jgi:hypothetical protein
MNILIGPRKNKKKSKSYDLKEKINHKKLRKLSAVFCYVELVSIVSLESDLFN